MIERQQDESGRYRQDHFLGRLVDKAEGRALTVEPRLPSIFEPANGFDAVPRDAVEPNESAPFEMDREVEVLVRVPLPAQDDADMFSLEDRVPTRERFEGARPGPIEDRVPAREPFEGARPRPLERPPHAVAGTVQPVSAEPTAAPQFVPIPRSITRHPAPDLSMKRTVIDESPVASFGAPVALPRVRGSPKAGNEPARTEMRAAAADNAVPASLTALRRMSRQTRKASATRPVDARAQARASQTDDSAKAVSAESSTTRRMPRKALRSTVEATLMPDLASSRQPAITPADAGLPAKAFSPSGNPLPVAGRLVESRISRTRPPRVEPPEKQGSHADEQWWNSSAIAAAPTINVTIGRIEIRAVPSAPVPTRSSLQAHKPGPMSLESYLKPERGRR